MTIPTQATFVYAVQRGSEEAFRRLVLSHWSTLERYRLVTSRPARVVSGRDHRGQLWIVERFEWADGAAAGRALAVDAVRGLWQRMESHLEHHGVLPVAPPPVRRSEPLAHLATSPV
jgi:hypothetical protein